MAIAQWTHAGHGVSVRAELLKNAPYEASQGSGLEVGDLWVLFLSIRGDDRWMAYGIVDNLEAEPEASLKAVNVERLKKFSVLIGERAQDITKDPFAASQKQRALATSLEEIREEIEPLTYEQLVKRRADKDWESMALHWKKMGMVISLN